jgi:hypothetical protein
VRRLSVQEVERPRPQPKTETTAPTSSASSTLDVVVTAFTGLGYALSARALLLLALIGAFVLAVMAMQSQTLAALETLVAYSFFTVIPVAYLEIRRRSE